MFASLMASRFSFCLSSTHRHAQLVTVVASGHLISCPERTIPSAAAARPRSVLAKVREPCVLYGLTVRKMLGSDEKWKGCSLRKIYGALLIPKRSTSLVLAGKIAKENASRE